MLNQDIQSISLANLFSMRAKISSELARRGVVRTKNTVGDYAEFLFCHALGWKLQRSSYAAYDAIDGDIRYQIKSRTTTKKWRQVQSSDFHDIDVATGQFDYLAMVVFDEEMQVINAAIIPFDLMLEDTKLRLDSKKESRKSWIYIFRRSILSHPKVMDVTANLQKAAVTP